jgi:hypothetical protein
MKIRKEVLERMKGRARDIKPRIMEEMAVTKQAVDYWFAQNKDNGWLTCKPILLIIGDVLNLTDEEILTEPEIKTQSN